MLIYAVYSNTVEKVRYDEENRRVYFNKGQYFDGVSKAVWEYQIGGYQVIAKYLKDRKKQELSLDEIVQYRKMAKAIERTIEVQRVVEEVFGKGYCSEQSERFRFLRAQLLLL